LDILIGFSKLFVFDFSGFVYSLNQTPIFFTWLVFLIFCLCTILIFLKLFGEVGMYMYTVISIIGANIQVLKIVDFPFFSSPIALGTILFSTTFLATDILSEHYGAKIARKNILIGFASFLVMTIFMLFTMGFTPLDAAKSGEEYSWALSTQDNLLGIFLPFPTFFAASMIAYLFSQYFDVWCYERISKITEKKFLWMRNNISTMLSALLDNTIFSLFAWIIFNPNPLDFNIVLFTFILGTYILRIIIAILDTPFIYLAKYFLPNEINE
jgi:uncharacterized integral membrane protein (TIGR00697 family)